MPLRPDDELGTRVASVLFSNYDVEEEIGRGGMGVVYCARDKRLKRRVAVKLLPPELGFRSDIRARFLREAETAAQLSHPNIVPIYSVEEKDNLVFFVMAYIAGDNIAKRLVDHGAMEPADVRRVLREVADALAYAHKRGVIHRDIKPDNILLDAESGRAMVTDFGIARALTDTHASRLTATGMAIGTPAYMSPEQSAGESEIDGRSDLYSLGVVGYQMASGELPFNAPNTPSMLVKHLSEIPMHVGDKRPDLPADLGRIIMTLLEKDPAQRFPDAQSLVIALSSGELPPHLHPHMPTLADENALANPRQRDRARSVLGKGGVVTGSQRDFQGAALSTDMRGSGVRVQFPGRGSSKPQQPTAEEFSRWNAGPVQRFRRKLAPYIAVNAVILPLSIFGDPDFLVVTFFWSIGMAVSYAKLWQEGYNWRDVFRQPRDRLLFDVAAETIDDARALFDEKKREEVRARARERAQAGGGLFPPMAPMPTTPASTFPPIGRKRREGGATPAAQAPPSVGPRYAPALNSIRLDYEEVQRQLHAMSKEERQQIPDVAASADAVYRRAMQAGTALGELDLQRAETPEEIEREISRLEEQANPLDFTASEERVRRLAHLKRQRRVVADLNSKRQEAENKLEHCRNLLRSMRLELLRYRSAGFGSTPQGLTQVTQQAQAVVKEMGYLSDAAAEVNAL